MSNQSAKAVLILYSILKRLILYDQYYLILSHAILYQSYQIFYSSSSELELKSSSEASTSWSSPLLSVGADGRGGSGGGADGGTKVSFNVSIDREVGNIDLRSRSALTSLEYFSDFSALVSVTIVDMFCILGSVSVLASCIVPCGNA